MTNWTQDDERQLIELNKRKEQAKLELEKPLRDVVENIWYRGCDNSDIRNGLIDNAKEITDALKPYLDGRITNE